MLRTRALALPLLLVLTLAGCGSPPPLPRALGSPSVFASAEEALAAAIVAYDRVLDIGDLVGQEGGQATERLRDVAVGDFLESSMRGAERWQREGLRQIGFSRFRDVHLLEHKGGLSRSVVVELCHDVSGVDLVNAEGQSVVPVDRDDTLHLRVEFSDEGGRLLVASATRLDELPC